MTMTARRSFVASCLLAVSLSHAVLCAAQEPAPEPRWGLEVLFGSAQVDPTDLNAFSLNREAVYGADYDTLYRYYSTVYGKNITLSVSSEGGLPIVDRSWTGALRASRRITSRITAVLAFDYLSRTRAASMSSSWQLTAYSPNAVAFPTSTGLSTSLDVQLAARSYSPSLGIRWTLWSPRPIALDVIALGGASYATCAIEQSGTQTSMPYSQSSSWSGGMNGTGWHASGEAGFRANWSVSRRWGTIFETTYRYERIPKITGSSDSQSTRRDGDAASAEYESQSNTSGRWQMVPYQATLQGRTINEPYPAIASGGGAPFALDLSGVRLRVGMVLRLR